MCSSHCKSWLVGDVLGNEHRSELAQEVQKENFCRLLSNRGRYILRC